jgi:hypothetical protein
MTAHYVRDVMIYLRCQLLRFIFWSLCWYDLCLRWLHNPDLKVAVLTGFQIACSKRSFVPSHYCSKNYLTVDILIISAFIILLFSSVKIMDVIVKLNSQTAGRDKIAR